MQSTIINKINSINQNQSFEQVCVFNCKHIEQRIFEGNCLIFSDADGPSCCLICVCIINLICDDIFKFLVRCTSYFVTMN